MAKRRRKECAKYRCRETAVIGGLCQQHFDEQEQRRLREDTATQALNTGRIDGEYLPEGALRGEFLARPRVVARSLLGHDGE